MDTDALNTLIEVMDEGTFSLDFAGTSVIIIRDGSVTCVSV